MRFKSVFETDQEALEALLSVHAVVDPEILDCTYNTGRIWKGIADRWSVFRTDLDPTGKLLQGGHIDLQADCTDLPFEDHCIDVLVFDPPHLSDAGKRGLVDADWGDRFGTSAEHGPRGENLLTLMDEFAGEATRVLRPTSGIILAKLTNMTHGQMSQDYVGAFRAICWHRGMNFCDEAIKIRQSKMVDPKWLKKPQRHLDKTHSYWLVIRNGRYC